MGVSCLGRAVDIPGGIIPTLNKRSAVPRHNEIDDNLARKICKDLGVLRIK
jgi:hypothetical protein